MHGSYRAPASNHDEVDYYAVDYAMDFICRHWNYSGEECYLEEVQQCVGPLTNCSCFSMPFIFVDADAAGANDGSSWCDAFVSLQAALAAATPGTRIQVANGTYKPSAVTDRTASFQLKNGVIIRGGFAGCGAANPNDRDFAQYETVLSGDLNGDDEPGFLNYADNSYHVVTADRIDATGILDGFTIRGGNATSGSNNGGGMANEHSSPTVINCTFSGNMATYSGGGMFNEGSSPTVTNCTFSGNTAMKGGGMENFWSSTTTVTNCTFSVNTATYGGGGMFNLSGSPTVTNCTFSGNTAINGGGMYNHSSSPTVTNCTFSGNTATWGGGMVNSYSSHPTVTNCILWGDAGGEIIDFEGVPSVTYSTVQGGYAGLGNIDADPLFVDVDGPDDTFGTEDDNLRLRPGSPCIDTGDNAAVAVSIDLDLHARVVDGNGDGTTTVDMGAYELQRLYVDAAAVVGADNGSSWCNAFVSLQDALGAATPGTTIQVANGTYKPSAGTDRTASFQLKKGVIIRGGFAGCGAANPNDRDFAQYETVLSGDLNGDDGPAFANYDDNSYHVIVTEGAPLIDGFTIRGGNANGSSSPTNRGGGMYNDSSSPTVENCRFLANRSTFAGGGMANYGTAAPRVTNCVFSGNGGSSVSGGGIINRGTGDPVITNCTFCQNSSFAGGGIDTNGLGTITNCILWGNTATIAGEPAVYQQIRNPGVGAVNYSTIQDWTLAHGVGNLNADPLFVDVDGPDDTFGTEDDNLRLRPGSPCIDTGKNAAVAVSSDLDLHARVVDGNGDGTTTVDMGAYEIRTGDCHAGQDGDVDYLDFAGFASCLAGPNSGPSEACFCFDLDGSGQIDLADMAIFQSVFTGE